MYIQKFIDVDDISNDDVCLCFSNTLAFATEPIFASLANILGNYERIPAPVTPEIRVCVFFLTDSKCL